jgi:hypothetical protein
MTASARFLHHFSQIAVYPKTHANIQAKLLIGQPSDRHEQEADQVAEQVMLMPDTQAPRTTLPVTRTEQPSAGKSSQQEYVPEIVYDVLGRAGSRLDTQTRAFFEPRLGVDLAQVRVHEDREAAGSATAVGARGYTFGNHIVFGAGQHGSGTTEGRRLLAHELTHVVQQRATGVTTDGVLFRSETGEDTVTLRAEVRRLEDEINKLAAKNEWEGVDRTYKSIETKSDEAFGLAQNAIGIHRLGAEAARNLGDIRRYKTLLVRAKTSLQSAGGEIDETALRDVEESLAQIEATYGAIRIAPRSEPKSEKKKAALRGPELVPGAMPFGQVERTSIQTARQEIMDTGYFKGMIPAGDYTLGDETFTVIAGTEMPGVLWGE